MQSKCQLFSNVVRNVSVYNCGDCIGGIVHWIPFSPLSNTNTNTNTNKTQMKIKVHNCVNWCNCVLKTFQSVALYKHKYKCKYKQNENTDTIAQLCAMHCALVKLCVKYLSVSCQAAQLCLKLNRHLISLSTLYLQCQTFFRFSLRCIISGAFWRISGEKQLLN